MNWPAVLAWLIAPIVTVGPVARWLVRRAKRTPYTPIMSRDGATLYMDRWWLFNPYDEVTRRSRYPWCPFNIRIHHIVNRDDPTAPLHDHPWNAASVILMGGYVEEREDRDDVVRYAGDVVGLRYGEFHRILEVAPGQGAVTLFITGRYRGTWGFLVGERKVPWREWLGVAE